MVWVNPAHAGMIPTIWLTTDQTQGKPRACGDNPPVNFIIKTVYTVNPAHAGMIRSPWTTSAPESCKPRACGDDPASPARTMCADR